MLAGVTYSEEVRGNAWARQSKMAVRRHVEPRSFTQTKGERSEWAPHALSLFSQKTRNQNRDPPFRPKTQTNEYISLASRTRISGDTTQDPFFFFFCILQLDTPHAPGPHNKANLCCTTLQVAGCEPHMSGRNPFYLLKIFLLTAEEGRVKW